MWSHGAWATCHGYVGNREEVGHRVGKSNTHDQGRPEERQGEDHHGGHQVHQVIQAEGQHQPECILLYPDKCGSDEIFPPVENVIFLVCKDEQGYDVAHHADRGHHEQQHALHHILKCKLGHFLLLFNRDDIDIYNYMSPAKLFSI